MTYEQWIETYKPIQNHICERGAMDGTMFETYGDDATFVGKNIDKNTVWTWIDNNDGGPDIILSGCWRINRLGYFVTEIPYKGERGDIAVDFD